MEDEHRPEGQLITERRTWLYVAGIFVLLCILEWLNEIVDLPHLLLGAPRTPINWHEAAVEIVLIAVTGLLVVLSLLSDISERKRVEEELRQRTAQLEALRQVGLEITAELDLDALLHSIVSRAVELVGGESGGLYLYRPDLDVLVWVMSVGPNLAPLGTTLRRGEGLSGQVWQTGEPLIVDDYQQWEGRAAVYEGYPFKAVVGVPMYWAGKFLGVLNVLGDASRAFSPADAHLLSLFATQAAIAIRNATLFEGEQEQRELTEALVEAAAVISSTLDPDQVLDRILEEVSRVVPNDAANIMLIEGDKARIVRWRGYERFGAEEFVSTVVFRISEVPNLKYMVESGKPMVIPDTATYPGWLDFPPQSWLRSYAAAPIIARGEVIGFLNVDSTTPGFFTQDQTEALRAFAGHAGTAIENARLYQAEQERRQVAETLRQASTVLSSTLELNEVLELILQQLRQVIPYDSASVQQLKDDHLEIAACQGFEEPDKVVGLVFPLDPKFPNHRVISTKSPLAVEDVVQDYPHFKDEADAYESGRIRSWLGVPLMVKDEVIGMIAVDRVEVRPYTTEEVQLAMAFANQAALAIENARLYEETRERTTELSILYEVVTVGITSVRLDEILNRTMAALQQTMQPDSIAILLLEPETNELVIRAHTGFPGGPELMRRPIGVGIPGWVVQSGQPVLLADVRGDERYHACAPDTRSELCVPLQVGERIIGALNLESHCLAAFSEDDLRLLSILAGHLAAVIENARLFEEIEERKMYLEGVLGSAPDAIVTLDAHHRIVEWNPGAQRLFGYSPQEVIGQDLDPLVANPETIQQARKFRQIVMSGKDLPPVETVRYRKDGSPVDVIVAASPILVRGELTGIVTVYTDITARKRIEEMLRALLLIDELTGLYNRRGFFTLGQQQLKIADRTRRAMFLLFADFDHLKGINDALGHLEGDRALIEVAHVFRETFRESDIVARIAGDEFVVLAMETGGASADVLATRLQKNLTAHNAREGRRYKLSLSVGVARYDPEDPCSIDELLARADRAMYEQKQNNGHFPKLEGCVAISIAERSKRGARRSSASVA